MLCKSLCFITKKSQTDWRATWGSCPRFFTTLNPEGGSGHEAKAKFYKPITGPGPSPDRPHNDFDTAIGLERLEYLAKTHGINIFDNEWLPGDRFGTYDDPIIVEAIGEDRIIGCTGKPKTTHETIWFNIAKGEIERCVECGQAFKVVDPVPIRVEDYLPKTPLPATEAELKALLDSIGIESTHLGPSETKTNKGDE